MSSIVSDNPTKATTNRALGTDHRRLFYLHDLPDYKVHHDDPDVRGWTVKLDGGQVVGKVDNLIVDKSLEKVRYLEVATDHEFATPYRDRTTYLDTEAGNTYNEDVDELVIVPIGMAKLDHANNSIHVNGVTADYIGLAPRYRRGSELRPRYEIESLHYYETAHPQFKEQAAGTTFDRTAYKDFDTKFKGMDDDFYMHRMFGNDNFYNRHDQAITSKGL